MWPVVATAAEAEGGRGAPANHPRGMLNSVTPNMVAKSLVRKLAHTCLNRGFAMITCSATKGSGLGTTHPGNVNEKIGWRSGRTLSDFLLCSLPRETRQL